MARLPGHLAALNATRLLICTDKGLVATGLVTRITDMLTDATVFDDTPANPREAAVMAAFALYRANDCDGMVGFGGGSSLDLAKAVRLLTGHPTPLAQYAAINGGVARIHGNTAPLFSIPTTSGTGSERLIGYGLSEFSSLWFCSVAKPDEDHNGLDRIHSCAAYAQAAALSKRSDRCGMRDRAAIVARSQPSWATTTGAVAQGLERDPVSCCRRERMIASAKGLSAGPCDALLFPSLAR